MAGIDLIEWQRDVLSDWGAVDEAGAFVHPSCGASVPRQAGKSATAIAWAVYLSVARGMKVLYTAHKYTTVLTMRDRMEQVMGSQADDPRARYPLFNREVARVDKQTSHETVELRNGGGVWFSTRTDAANLGDSFDVVIYDEAQRLTDGQFQAMSPTTSAAPSGNPQAVFIGTPPHPGGPGTVFEHMRSEVLAGASAGTCWWEWGVDEVGDVSDESRWYQANPSLGRVTVPASLRKDLGKMDELGFAQEYLGYWLPAAASAVLAPAEWEACRVEPGAAPLEGRVAYGVRFKADGSEVAVAACVHPSEGPDHVECVFSCGTARGTAWLADWLAERSGVGSCVAVDGQSAADALCDRLRGRVPRLFVRRVGTSDAIAAPPIMLDAIRTRQVTHIAQPALDASALGATRRAIGSKGGWGWGGDGACPIEAASLALWAARTSKRDPGRKLRMG